MPDALCRLSLTSVATWAAIATALAAIATAIIVSHQVRQEGRLDRLTIGVDVLLRLEQDWESSRMARKREGAARELLAEDPGLNVEDVLDWFETVALLVRRGAIDEEVTWHTFFLWMSHYWYASESYIREVREQESRATWNDLCELMPRLLDRDLKASGKPFRADSSEVREFLEDEARLTSQGN